MDLIYINEDNTEEYIIVSIFLDVNSSAKNWRIQSKKMDDWETL